MTASSAASAMRLAPKSSASISLAVKAQRAQLMLHTHRGAALLADGASAGSINVAPSPSRAISGRQARPPAASVSRMTAPASRAAPSGASMLSAASRSGSTSRSIERAFATDDLADRLARRRPQQPRQRQIVERAGARHAPRWIENPQRQAAVVEAQRPALAACEIDEGKLRRRRTDQLLLGADAAQIVERGAIAGQQQMIAVVDRHADRCVVIGAAAAAGEGGGLVHDDRCGRAT